MRAIEEQSVVKVPIDVESLVEIFGKIRYAIAGEADKMTEDINKLKFEDFGFPETCEASSFTAIDGSYVFLWRVGTTSIAAIRVAAITYDRDFRIVNQLCDDRVVLLSFDESMVSYINDSVMRHILRLTSSRPSLTRKLTDKEKENRPSNSEENAGIVDEKATSPYATKDRSEFVAELYMVAREFEMAEKVSNIHHEAIVAVDGALARRSEIPFKQYIDGTVRNCVHNSSAFIGIVKDTSKSSLGSMFQDETYASEIAKMKNLQACWYLEVQGEVKLRYAKLHPLAIKPFRIDIHEKTLNSKSWCYDPLRVIVNTAYFASNELSLGYPFPSAEAHQVAVTLRHMFPALQSVCLQAAIESGFSYQQALSGLTSIYGVTRSDFHFHLDDISKKGKGALSIGGSIKK